MNTNQTKHPTWYTQEDETTWEKVKAAFRRDWNQTKHDFGGREPNLNQQVGDTVSQAMGSEPIPAGNAGNARSNPDKIDNYSETDEDAYRYGYAASKHFPNQGEWTPETEAIFDEIWDDKNQWERKREAARRAWTYGYSQPSAK